jgi:imidazole glycerol-phosphate synthase subunit HisH
MSKTTIIDYGAGNVKSVSFALERLGINPVLSNDPDEIRTSDYVIFPGVGHAKTAMEALQKNNLVDLIPALTQPVLGVCLGMQLMCRFSEEGNTPGLGIFDADVIRFDEHLKVPHMGWNTLIEGRELLQGIEDQVYFVHSYYVPECSETMAVCDYHGRFSAALVKDNFYGCQFHPEKSGNAGAEILKRFLNV